MMIVGLTGGIGSGKTAVSNIFKKLGIEIIDTDVIARQLIDTEPSVIYEVIEKFGDAIQNADGTIDRKKLARTIFSNSSNKQYLEKILHPRIRAQTRIKIDHFASSKKPAYIIVVVPLLFETDFGDIIDRSIAVIAEESIRISRVKERDNRTMDEIRSIIKSQVNDDARLEKADDIIENNNEFNQLEERVKELHVIYTNLSAKYS